jgi:hypothetical protein
MRHAGRVGGAQWHRVRHPHGGDYAFHEIQAAITHAYADPGTPARAPLLIDGRSSLKEVVPHLSRVTVLWNPDQRDFALDWQELRAAADAMAVTLHSLEVRIPARTVESALAHVITREGAEGLLGLPIDCTTCSRSTWPLLRPGPTSQVSTPIGRSQRQGAHVLRAEPPPAIPACRHACRQDPGMLQRLAKALGVPVTRLLK